MPSLNDLMFEYYSRAVPTAGGGTGTGVVTEDSQISNQYDSVFGYGTQTAPTAGLAVATIASGSLPVGYYEITVEVAIDAGVPAAAERDNMEVRAGATVLKRIIMNPAASPDVRSVKMWRTLNGSTAITVNAVGAATASVVYRASITATRTA